MAAAELFTTSLINDANLEAYYRFTSGSDTTDSSSNSNTLTHVNSPTNTTGKFADGMLYDSPSNEYSWAADSASLDILGDLSVSMWANFQTLPSGIPEAAGLCTKAGAAGNRSWRIEVSTSDILNVIYYGDGTNATQRNSSAAIFVGGDVGNFVSLIVTMDVSAKEILVYKDGVSVTMDAVTGTQTSIFNSSERMGINAFQATTSPQRHGDVTLDDVAIFSRVLTPAEVDGIANGFAPGGNPMFFSGGGVTVG